MAQTGSLVLTLIANPVERSLTPDIATAVETAVGASHLYWLDDGIAADIPLPGEATIDTARTKAQQALGDADIDVVVQGGESRRKSFLIADMDSTMINQECIDELAAEMGIKDQVADITARAMNGEIEFDSALRARVGLLKGLSTSVIESVYSDRITMASGGKTLLNTMKAKGAYSALVSGGFTHFTSKVAAALGFDENRANTLVMDGDTLSGKVGTPILGSDAKVQALQEITQQRGLEISDAIAVGDGANDLPMLRRAGTGIALHAKPSVAAQANIRIDHGDLTALLYIQGYRRSDFVEA